LQPNSIDQSSRQSACRREGINLAVFWRKATRPGCRGLRQAAGIRALIFPHFFETVTEALDDRHNPLRYRPHRLPAHWRRPPSAFLLALRLPLQRQVHSEGRGCICLHGHREIFSTEETVSLFDAVDVNQAASAINPERLLWQNHHYFLYAGLAVKTGRARYVHRALLISPGPPEKLEMGAERNGQRQPYHRQ
jgi:hypothetical protein